jgi:spore germination cell wall hydrolase CwlJ-like protein
MATQGIIAEGSISAKRRLAAVVVVIALVAAGALAMLGLLGRPGGTTMQARIAAAASARADSPVPVVEPLVLDTSNPDEARRRNAEIPFSTDPNPAARPFHFSGDTAARERATDCLAAAMLYEAGDDPKGERAVGQVVLNRLRHPAFPKTVCGVVFQGQERTTGCQFTFTCDGAMARIPNPVAWARARNLASGMLAGDVYKEVGYSTHYHTDWVMPYWSSSLDKVTAVDTHLFFRWKGWWGTPGAFARALAIAAEPVIAKLALLSPAHKAGGTEDLFALPQLSGSLIDDSRPPMAVGADLVGKRIGPGKLAAIEAGGNGFVMTLDKGGDPARYAEAAARLCAGRTQCRLLAWTNAAATPQGFPIEDAHLASMSFAYIRQKDSGVERMLYNCDEFPATPSIKCMTRMLPAAPARRLLADEQAEKMKVRLPDGLKPAADQKAGALAPASRLEADKPRPRADTRPAASTSIAGTL